MDPQASGPYSRRRGVAHSKRERPADDRRERRGRETMARFGPAPKRTIPLGGRLAPAVASTGTKGCGLVRLAPASDPVGPSRQDPPPARPRRRTGVPVTLAYDLPRIGRYRLYDRAGKKGTLWRCRLCGRSLKVDSLWAHWDIEQSLLFRRFNVLTAEEYRELRI